MQDGPQWYDFHNSFNESQLIGSKVVTDEGKWWTWNHKYNAENKNNELILITYFHQMKM
jgi:hypothetical protein